MLRKPAAPRQCLFLTRSTPRRVALDARQKSEALLQCSLVASLPRALFVELIVQQSRMPTQFLGDQLLVCICFWFAFAPRGSRALHVSLKRPTPRIHRSAFRPRREPGAHQHGVPWLASSSENPCEVKSSQRGGGCPSALERETRVQRTRHSQLLLLSGIGDRILRPD